MLRILAMEVAAIVVLQTTHPSDLFAALARLRVPYLLNVMIALTLQLVPVLQREVGTVLAAQRSRGMRGSGFAAVIPAFVPVFAGTVERVQQLAISLESRGFGAIGPADLVPPGRASRPGTPRSPSRASCSVSSASGPRSRASGSSLRWRSRPRSRSPIFLVALAVFVASLVRAFVAIGRA